MTQVYEWTEELLKLSLKRLQQEDRMTEGPAEHESNGRWMKVHGTSDTPLYYIWSGIKRRCLSPTHYAYARYGGRGITICDRWKNSFAEFAKDVGPRPDGLTLDRIDNNGNYEPGNVRWATWTQQQRNRRDNRPVTVNGVTLLVVEWAQKTGISRESIYARTARGWSWERAVSTPPMERHRKDWRGESDRTCTRCQQTKPLAEFVKASRYPSGRGSHCTMCNRMLAMDYSRRKATV